MRTRAFFLVALIFLFRADPGAADPAAGVPLTVLHVNDFHGKLQPAPPKPGNDNAPAGGAALLAGRIRQVRHALIALDPSLYERALGGELRVEDGNGFPLDLEGALTEGMAIFTKPA